MGSESEMSSGLRKALSLSPDTKVHFKLGTLYGIAGAMVSAVVFVYAIKTKVDQTYEAVSELSQKVEKPLEHVAILWDEHTRTAQYRLDRSAR